MPTVRRHLEVDPNPTLSAPPYVPSRGSNLPRGKSEQRAVDMEITDTAEGRCCPINYGRFRFSVPLVHADIVSSKLELIGLIGEGPIDAVEYVWVDEQQVYPSPPAWATCQVKLGTTDQTRVTNISNATVDDWTHPGYAYVAMQLTLSTAPIQGGIPRIEVQGRGIICQDLSAEVETWAWTENPIWHLADALARTEYGVAVGSEEIDAGNSEPHAGFSAAADECNEVISYDDFQPIGQEDSNQQLLLSTYDRNQSFEAPARGFRVTIKIRAVSTLSETIPFPCVIRTTASGTDIPPDVVCDPITPVADTDYELWGTWHDTHGFTAGQTLYIVTEATGAPYSVAELPGTGTDITDAGLDNVDWVDPDHIQAMGSSVATCGPVVDRASSKYLKGVGFGFAVPSDATITGIKLRIARRAMFHDSMDGYPLPPGNDVHDHRVRLVRAGTVESTDKATTTHWGTSEGIASYGGNGDMWGASWVPADVNSATFGAVLSAHIAAPDVTLFGYDGNYAYVNWFEITVYYTGAGGGPGANTKWHHNSLTNAYADGAAQYYNGSWLAQNYDHWFRVSTSEQKYRSALTILDRQPIEELARTLLLTCNGRLGWWDGKYRVSLDSIASVAATISDDPADNPDIPILGGTLACSRSDAEVPNTCIGTYYDTEDWQRKEVRKLSAAALNGAQQPREMRVSAAAVPSGGQLYRLLCTWLNRAQRTWRAACDVPQHGLTVCPGDLLTLSSRLFTGTKTVLIEEMTDNQDGTFTLSLCEYNAADFESTGYVAQSIVTTTTVT